MSAIIGWDLGGAHVKAARVEGGRVTAAIQVACPLWLGLDRLDEALAAARATLGEAGLHAATMTGELSDIFASRAEGVPVIAEALQGAVAPAGVRLYGGRAGFLAPDAAAAHALDIASANWHASAALVARILPSALFADMGSTTTDLIPVAGGAVAALGYTDAERLVEGELVYTGLTRSFLMAVCDRVPFRGRWVTLMNEYFATMADVFRILGSLDEAADQHKTADNREKTPEASRVRLARMIGLDAADASPAEWEALAAFFAQAQLRSLEDQARLVLSRGILAADAPVVGAGVGSSVTARLAERLGRPYRAFDALIEAAPEAQHWAGHCAPATAVALLAAAEAG